MKYSFKIGSAWSIPIELHVTFILMMAVIFFVSYPQLYPFILVISLFVFGAIHEISHSLVSKHYKIKVHKIVLYPIGGISWVQKIPENPRIEWRVAIAGPLTSFIIGGVLLVSNEIISIETPLLIPSLTINTGSLMLDLAILNLILGAFNLFPAFPLDGGRLLRAFLAKRMRFSDATKYATSISRLLSVIMAIVGLLYDFWLVVIGLFVYIGAKAELRIASTIRVKDIMHPRVASVKPETTLKEALEIMFKARYHDIPIEKDGSYLGIATWKEIMKIKPEQRTEIRVEQLPKKAVLVFLDEPVLEAYKIMSREKIDLVPVIDRETPTKVVGVVATEFTHTAYT